MDYLEYSLIVILFSLSGVHSRFYEWSKLLTSVLSLSHHWSCSITTAGAIYVGPVVSIHRVHAERTYSHHPSDLRQSTRWYLITLLCQGERPQETVFEGARRERGNLRL